MPDFKDKLLDAKNVSRVEVTAYGTMGYMGINQDRMEVKIFGQDGKLAQDLFVNLKRSYEPFEIKLTDHTEDKNKVSFQQHFDLNTSPLVKDELNAITDRLALYEKNGVKVKYAFTDPDRVNSKGQPFSRESWLMPEDVKGKNKAQIEELTNQFHKDTVEGFIAPIKEASKTHKYKTNGDQFESPYSAIDLGEEKIFKMLEDRNFKFTGSKIDASFMGKDRELMREIESNYKNIVSKLYSEINDVAGKDEHGNKKFDDGDKVKDLYSYQEVKFLDKFIGKLNEKLDKGTLTKDDINDYVTSLDAISNYGNNLSTSSSRHIPALKDIAKKQGFEIN